MSLILQSRCKISSVEGGEKRKAEELCSNICAICAIYSSTRIAVLVRRNGVSVDFRCSDSKLRYVASELQRRALLDFHSISSGIRSTFHPKRARREKESKRAQTAPIHEPLYPSSLPRGGREKNWVSTRSAGWTRTICTRKPFYGGGTMAGR